MTIDYFKINIILLLRDHFRNLSEIGIPKTKIYKYLC